MERVINMALTSIFLYAWAHAYKKIEVSAILITRSIYQNLVFRCLMFVY